MHVTVTTILNQTVKLTLFLLSYRKLRFHVNQLKEVLKKIIISGSHLSVYAGLSLISLIELGYWISELLVFSMVAKCMEFYRT